VDNRNGQVADRPTVAPPVRRVEVPASLSARWHRLEAAAWVHRLLMLQVVLLVLLTAVTAVGGLVAGAPLLWLLPAALAALAAWLARAWGEERRWTWCAVLALTVLSAGSDLLGVADGLPWWRVAWALFDALLLALLAHPDSTARLDPRRPPARRPAWVPERPPRS
jgi:hypothetical protein